MLSSPLLTLSGKKHSSPACLWCMYKIPSYAWRSRARVDLLIALSSCQIKLYADDAKVFDFKKKSEVSVAGLQRDLTSLQLWCNEWQMSINGGKCSLLQIGWNPIPNTRYVLGGTDATREACVKDLGVQISGRLTFAEHCSYVVSNASRRVGLVYRAFSSRDAQFMIGMFVTYVRPLLEYNTEVWSPVYLRDIDKVESIQRSFTKRIKGLFNKTYLERLEYCSLESLELRRIKTDVMLVYKMMHKMVDLSFDDYFKYAPVVGTRGNSLKLYPSLATKVVTFNYFGNRVVNYWNALPEVVVTAPSLAVFKKKLLEHQNCLLVFLKGRALRNP